MNPNEETTASGNPTTEPPGAATGLFRSLTNLAATLIAVAQTRIELLVTELQEEVQRTAGLAIWALIALLSLMVGLLLAGLTVIFAFWDTHRLLASLIVTGSFLAIALAAVLVLIAKVNARPRFLGTTLSELSKDADSLRRRV